MLFNSVVASVLLASGAYAQSSSIQVQVVQVSNSNGSLAYFPEQVTAAPGTMVQFQFHPKNHTVTQSSFAEPCVPLTQTTNATSMLKSGFMPVAADATEIPVFSVMINDTKPIWLYCGQEGHCQKGMVMSINANDSSPNNLSAFKVKASQFKSTSTSSGASSSSSGSSSSGSGSSDGTSSGGSSTTSSNNPAQETTSGANAKPDASTGLTALVVMAVTGLAVLVL